MLYPIILFNILIYIESVKKKRSKDVSATVRSILKYLDIEV